MIRFGPMTWQSSARLVALACWATALALTGGMGWHAWSALEDAAHGSRYHASQVNSGMIAMRALTDAEIVANKNRVAR